MKVETALIPVTTIEKCAQITLSENEVKLLCTLLGNLSFNAVATACKIAYKSEETGKVWLNMVEFYQQISAENLFDDGG